MLSKETIQLLTENNATVIGTFEGIAVVETRDKEDNEALLGLAGAFVTDLGEQVIVVGCNFNKLSTDTQQFILYHEEGHFCYNHRSTEWTIEHEYLADGYAVKYMGKEAVVDGIVEMATLVNVQNHESIINRVNYIRGIQ